jgi:hypothetical protein
MQSVQLLYEKGRIRIRSRIRLEVQKHADPPGVRKKSFRIRNEFEKKTTLTN